jgi:hypothetical protein
MARYVSRWGNPDAGDAGPTPAIVGGAVLGLVPFALVALAFWATFAPRPRVGRRHLRSRRGKG